MLHLLDERVRRTDVDHAEVVDHVHRLVALVRRSQPSLVLVEQEVFPVGCIGLGEMVSRSRSVDGSRIRTKNGFSEGLGFVSVLDRGGFTTDEATDVGLWRMEDKEEGGGKKNGKEGGKEGRCE